MTEETTLQAVDENWERALAVVAHPDDLEYGAASAIARWTSQGKEVTYLLVTRGEAGIDGMNPEEAGPLREEEERRSARVVGVDAVEFLEYSDGVIEYGLPLRRDIARVIRRVRPDVLITLNMELSWGGNFLNMADHRAVGLAVLDASRDAANRWIFRELLEEGLEPWPGAHAVYLSGSPNPTHYVDVTESVERGIASLREHAAYLAGLGGDFDVAAFMRERARQVGERAGCELAVALELYRT